MTQDQLADACVRLGRKVERPNVQRWESQEHIPRVATFAALARVLGVPMDVLYYGEQEAARIAAERFASRGGRA